jgi:hypothetical protein
MMELKKIKLRESFQNIILMIVKIKKYFIVIKILNWNKKYKNIPIHLKDFINSNKIKIK